MSDPRIDCDAIRMSLGAYVLGALEPADQLAVERHLPECPECAAESDELAGVIPVLASVSADDLAPMSPSPDLFDRIVAAVSTAPAPSGAAAQVPAAVPVATHPGGRPVTYLADPARRPRRWLLAAAAAVIVLAGGGTAIGIALSSDSPTATVAVGTSHGVRMRITATDAGARTSLGITVAGLPTDERCHLVAIAADGTRHDAGTWDASYEGAARLTESTDLPLAQLRRLTLFGRDGRSLVVVDL